MRTLEEDVIQFYEEAIVVLKRYPIDMKYIPYYDTKEKLIRDIEKVVKEMRKARTSEAYFREEKLREAIFMLQLNVQIRYGKYISELAKEAKK